MIILGTVKWFDAQRGFGFIARRGTKNPDIFVHYSGISRYGGYRKLVEGQRVFFQIVRGKNGPMAINVEVLQDPPPKPVTKKNFYH